MAAVVPPTSFHSSSHLFRPYHYNFTAFHRGPALSHYTPEAFAPRHYSGANSRSASASWRHSGPVSSRSPSPKPKGNRSRPSHSRTPSTFSNSNWRSHTPVPAITKVDVARNLNVSAPFVYSFAELLRLSLSPLVGISKESQVVVDDLVAHHVWRRGPRLGVTRTDSRRNNRSTPKSPTSTSTEDSDHSD
ncbi:hypothetical protein F5148DRAFT_433570 [Russula earlei]|uniref:Uncharacterized protein n=1 Tax=Russula earlei TaxID=71964 RepID=A0ACC0UIF4_9AGAM|nr:hypothetical protein F5148DRAFT_433570 [Russula earlei]